MSTKQGLLLLDEKVLTAKSLAFRILSRFGFRLFARDGQSGSRGSREDALGEISRIGRLQQARDPSISLAQFLLFLPDHFAKVLVDTFPKDKRQVLDQFLASLRVEAQRNVSIVDDCNQWFSRLQEVGLDYVRLYVGPQLPVRFAPLRFDVFEELMLDATGGATNQPSAALERIIELSFNPDHFSSPSYYSTLCVLSHEFWCHALSRFRNHPDLPAVSQDAWGCSPEDLWEEGWMDFVQSLILQWELERIVNDELTIPAFQENCPRFGDSRNDPIRGEARSYGYRTALHVHKFLQQRFRQSDHFACFVRLSLELNAIDCSPDVKQDFVYALSQCFDLDPAVVGTPQSLDQHQRLLVEQRERLFIALRDAGAEDSIIDLTRLLKILKIKA